MEPITVTQSGFTQIITFTYTKAANPEHAVPFILKLLVNRFSSYVPVSAVLHC